MNSYRAREAELGSPDPTLVAVSNTCLISGLVLSFIILATALLSPRIKRLSTWFNLLITGIVFAISFLLLVGQQSGPQPGFGICLFQAMLLYAAPTMASFSAATFGIEMFLLVRYVLSAKHDKEPQPKRRFLLIIPWVVHLGISLEVLILGIMEPERVRRDVETSTYCHIESHIPARITASLAICGVIVTLVALGLTIQALYRNRDDTSLQQFRQDTMMNRMVIRILIYSILPILALILSIMKLPSKELGSRIFVIMLSLFPLWSAIILGLHSDILRAWAFKRSAPYTSELSKPSDFGFKRDSKSDV